MCQQAQKIVQSYLFFWDFFVLLPKNTWNNEENNIFYNGCCGFCRM